MFLLAAAALAETPVAAFDPGATGRDLAVTGAILSGGGVALLGVAGVLSATDVPQDGCIEWCGNLALTLVTGGAGILFLMPGAIITLSGASVMEGQDARGGLHSLPVAVGWGLAGLGTLSFATGGWVAADGEIDWDPQPFVYAGLGLFAGAAGAGVVQVAIRKEGHAVLTARLVPTGAGVALTGAF